MKLALWPVSLREFRPCSDPSTRCFARRRTGRSGRTTRSRCNLPYSMCGTPSSSLLRYPAAVQSRLSFADAQIHPASGSGLQHRATIERGPALLLLHAVLESVPLSLADGVSNSAPGIDKKLDKIPIPFSVSS